MKRTMGIVLLAFLGGCSSFQPGTDVANSYYAGGRLNSIPGTAQTTWKENDRYRMYQSNGSFASAGMSDSAAARSSPTPPSDSFADPLLATARAAGDTTAQAMPGATLPASLATASLAGAAAVSPTVQHSGDLPILDRVPPEEEVKGAGFTDFPSAEEKTGPTNPADAAPEPGVQGMNDSAFPPRAPQKTKVPVGSVQEAGAGPKATQETIFPVKDHSDDPFAAKGNGDGMASPKGGGPAAVPGKPVMVTFGKDPEVAGKTEESAVQETPGKIEEAVPADQAKASGDLAMLDRQPKKAGPPAVRMVNSKRITINYEVKDIGPSGVSGVELWCTQDGKTWKKRDMSRQIQPPYVVEVEEEGLYGFTLLARNGIGLGAEAPKPGDLPQIWVEVDMTSPVVHLTGVNASCTGKCQNVIVHWKASDKNLGPRPITISYAASEAGPWEVIAEHVANTGRYVWPMPPATPDRFLVRVEATDLVGNVGASQTPKPVLMDRAQPVVNILNVDAVGK